MERSRGTCSWNRSCWLVTSPPRRGSYQLDPSHPTDVTGHHPVRDHGDDMTSRILLTGGTGTLGRLVAPLLLAAGADVRVLSRAARTPDGADDGTTRFRGDLSTGEGVEAAVAGVDTIVHCAGNQ